VQYKSRETWNYYNDKISSVCKTHLNTVRPVQCKSHRRRMRSF